MNKKTLKKLKKKLSGIGRGDSEIVVITKTVRAPRKKDRRDRR